MLYIPLLYRYKYVTTTPTTQRHLVMLEEYRHVNREIVSDPGIYSGHSTPVESPTVILVTVAVIDLRVQ